MTDPTPEPRLAALVTRLQRSLGQGLGWKLPLLVALLFGHCLAQGLQMDDYWFRIALTHDPRWPRMQHPLWAQFTFFTGDVATGEWARSLGITAWWSNPTGRADFFRPLSSLSHALDYALTRAPWWMHLHSLAWFAAVLLVAATLYRRVLPARAAAVATLLYALDPAHSGVVAWVANRNALLAAAFGLLAVVAHDRAVRDDHRPSRQAGPLLLCVALLCGESSLGALGYLAAHGLTLDRRPWRARLASLAPYAAVVAVWAVFYRLHHYGVRGSGMYLDPAADPLRFALEVPRNALVLCASLWGFVSPDLAILAPEAMPAIVALALGSVAVGLVALGPSLVRDPAVRFLTLGGALSVAPSCATVPAGRLLLVTSVGLLGALAVGVVQSVDRTTPLTSSKDLTPNPLSLAGEGAEMPAISTLQAPSPARERGLGVRSLDEVRRVASGWFGYGVGVGRLALGVLLTPLMAWQLVLLDGAFLRCADSFAHDDAALSGQRVVVVNAPDAAFAGYLIVHRQQYGWTVPRAMVSLAVGTRDVTLLRVDDRTVEVTSDRGFYRYATDALMRDPTDPLPVGSRIDLGDVEVEVTHATADGRPDRARFRFQDGAASARFRWVRWDGQRYQPFALPAVGATVRERAIPLRP